MDKELKETLDLILVKMEKLSTKLDVLENKITLLENSSSPVTNKFPTNTKGIKEQIDAMRNGLMSRHKSQMNSVGVSIESPGFSLSPGAPNTPQPLILADEE